jgi:hypothetical protein
MQNQVANMSKVESILADSGAKIEVNGISVTVIHLPESDIDVNTPQYFLKMDELEMFETYSSPQMALSKGRQLIEEETDTLIATLQKDVRRADVLLDDAPSDISREKLIQYKDNIVRLLNKLDKIETEALQTA